MFKEIEKTKIGHVSGKEIFCKVTLKKKKEQKIHPNQRHQQICYLPFLFQYVYVFYTHTHQERRKF